MDKEIAIVIATGLMCILLGYIYTIDHATQSLVFVVVSSMASYWFARSGNGNSNGNGNDKQ